MKVTFLGTGTSQGVPMIGCSCEVCTSDTPEDNRLRSSVWIQIEDISIVIDTGPDFRYQALRSQIPHIDALLFTHGHKDHVAGMDDIRAYNYWQQGAIDIFANIETQAVLKREFAYVFADHKYPGIPEINLNTIDSTTFYVKGIPITPIKVKHYKMDVLGFRIGDFTYITDANFISEAEQEKVRGSKVMVLNALRHEKHISHFTLSEAVDLVQKIGIEQAYFTHISHQLGTHEAVSRILPDNVALAYDQLEVSL